MYPSGMPEEHERCSDWTAFFRLSLVAIGAGILTWLFSLLA